MTVVEFNRDWVPVLQLAVAVAGLGSLILVWWQIRQTTLWNRLQATYTFLNPQAVELHTRLAKEAARVGIDLKDRLLPLTDAEVEKLWSDQQCMAAFKSIANEFESTCASVRLGIVDPGVAYALHNGRVIQFFKVYAPLIFKLRNHYQIDDLAIELQRVCEAWQEKKATLEERHQKALKRQAAKLARLKGVPRKV